MDLEYSLKDVKEVATGLWDRFRDHRIFAFHGPLGAGKTTLIHALCDARWVKDTVSSPTFSIINEYLFQEGSERRTIFHIDLYRLKDEDEAIRAGVDDCLSSGQICLVEWPDRAPGLFPENTVHLHFEVLDETRRRLKINGN
jgi:tRNA threonylcarbamoyladenosine biosynthesis protein TsaE